MDKVKVEAVQYDGEDVGPVARFLGAETLVPGKTAQGADGPSFTSAGTDYVLEPGDWVVRVAPGHHVACDEKVFGSTYTTG